MALLTSVNSSLPWAALAKVLELPLTSAALPSRTDCPFCGKRRLYVFKDSIMDGHWHYCYDCHKSGDLLELAANVWGMSKQGALQKLRLEGFQCPELTPEMLEEYADEHHFRQERWQELWAKVSRQLATCKFTGLAALRNRYRLLGQYSTERWLAGPGKFVGGGTVKQIESGLIRSSRLRENGRVRDRPIFKGKNWKDALVIPYYTAPERIVGMWFVGRNGAADSRVYHGIRRTRQTVIEAGLAGLSSVEDSRGHFGPYVFAVEDPLLMLRLQVRHMQTSTLPLPIVSYHEDQRFRTCDAWQALLHNKVVIWTWHITPAIVWQAMRADADISLVKLNNPSRKSIGHYLRLMSPRDVLRRAIKQAKPWRAAIAAWAEEAQPGALEELLIGLSAYRDFDVAKLTKEIGLLVDTPLLVPRVRSVRLNSELEVIERSDGWWYYKAPNDWKGKRDVALRLVTDARITIKRVVMGEIPRYEGYVELNGRTAPFAVTVTEAGYQAKKWLVHTCLQAGIGHPTVPNTKIPLFDVALALSTPEYVTPGQPEPPEPPSV